MTTSQRPLDTSYLDIVRGLAAFWVVVVHCAIWSVGSVGAADLLEPKKAVDLFMIISGFLMFLTVNKNARRENPMKWATWRAFYLRRYFRITPVYYGALAVVLIMWRRFSGGYLSLMALNPAHWHHSTFISDTPTAVGPLSIALHATYLFGLFPAYSHSTDLPDWSLSLEMQFYAAFPLIYMASRKFGMLPTAVIISLLSFVITRQFYRLAEAGAISGFVEPSLLFFKLPVFLAGGLIYEASKGRRIRHLVLAFVILIVCLRNYRESMALVLLLVGVFAALGTATQPAPVMKLAKSRVVRFMADTSYCAYLIHGFVIALAGPWFLRRVGATEVTTPFFALAGLTICVTYPLAWVVHRFIELPGIALGKRVVGNDDRAHVDPHAVSSALGSDG